MKQMILCPECKSLVSFNLYFGAYICHKCKWRDDSYNEKRIKEYRKIIRSK